MNPDREIEALLRLLGVWDNRQEPIDLVPADSVPQSSIRLPTPATLEGLFRYCLDICGPVSRQFLGGLTEFVTDLGVKARIEALASDRHVFYEKVTSKRLSLAAVLQDIATPQDVTGEVSSNLNIPVSVSYVLENLKKLQPRNYSISSSAFVDPRAVAVTILAVSDYYEAPADAYHFRGVASNYLLQLQQEFARDRSGAQAFAASYSTAGPLNLLHGGRVFARIRRSNFKLPPDSSTPIIMIGSGTGIAPFRAFVQERMKLKMQGLEVGKTMLVPGHRAPDDDYYHNDVWQEAQEILGELFELYPAFSRAEQQPRQYVQDILATKSELVLRILAAKRPGILYICGSSLMAKGVKECLASVWSQGSEQCSSHAQKTADDWLKDLDCLGCLQEDTWG
jgi:NADPH-ferrihemoprotein reductase